MVAHLLHTAVYWNLLKFTEIYWNLLDLLDLLIIYVYSLFVDICDGNMRAILSLFYNLSQHKKMSSKGQAPIQD